MADALRLSPREVARIRPGLPTEDRTLLREASEASDEAVELLIRRARPALVSRPRWPIAVVGLGIAVAALALWLRSSPAPTYDAPDVPLDTPTHLALRGPLQLGPSIEVSGLAQVQVEQADTERTIVWVERGSAFFDVDPNGPYRHLTVRAADTQVHVRGTQFIVQALYDSVHVEVLRGRVEVERDGESTAVSAGESWSHQAPLAVSSLSLPTVEHLAATPIQIAAVPAPHDVPAPQQVQEPEVLAAPVAVPDEAPVPDSPQRAYAALLDSLDGGARPSSVARGLDAFLQRWPDHPLTPEVSALRLEVAAELEDPRTVVADLETWLARWPDHPRRLALLELHATLARDRLQDCGLALPSYRALGLEAGPTSAARAETWRGLCALQLGDRTEARQALTRAGELGVPEDLAARVEEAWAALSP